jgi:YD repeat-containing protein
MNPIGDFSLSEYKIQYRNVDILEYDESLDKNNGKKSFTFNVPDCPMINLYEGVYLANAYTTSSGSNGIFRTYDGQKPTVKSISHFDNTDKLVKKEVFEYKKTESNTYEGLKAQRKVSSSGGEMPIYPNQPYGSTIYDSHQSDYFHISSYVDWMKYEIETGTDILSSKTDTSFTSSGNIVSIESYDYTDKYQIKKVSLANNTNDIISINEFKYPQDFVSGDNVYKQMVDKNMISPIIEKTSRIKNDQGVKKNRTDYIANSNMFLPSLVKVSLGDNERTVLKYDRYDNEGNILQYTTLDGISTTILWSYNGQYPVAEIKNAIYEDVIDVLGGQDYIDYLTKIEILPDNQIVQLNSIRYTLPNAQVTTYTYKPLVGISSMTDPRGVTTFYEYDDFNRLIATKDKDGHIIKSFEYNYQH